MTYKVAIVTGGASGMGLAVAKALSADGWRVYIFYHQKLPGDEEANSLPFIRFIQADVTSWSSLSDAFSQTYLESGRVDFVFANAGVVDEDYFFDLKLQGPLNTSTIDVNLRGAIDTSHFAWKYFLLSPHGGKGAVLVINASIAGLYPVGISPMYSASKGGIIAFMRALSKDLFESYGTRVHALCPGLVRTSLLADEQWEKFSDELFVPMQSIVDAVVALIDDKPFIDSLKRLVGLESKFGLAIEVTPRGYYVKEGYKMTDASTPLLLEELPQLGDILNRSG